MAISRAIRSMVSSRLGRAACVCPDRGMGERGGKGRSERARERMGEEGGSEGARERRGGGNEGANEGASEGGSERGSERGRSYLPSAPTAGLGAR